MLVLVWEVYGDCANDALGVDENNGSVKRCQEIHCHNCVRRCSDSMRELSEVKKDEPISAIE